MQPTCMLYACDVPWCKTLTRFCVCVAATPHTSYTQAATSPRMPAASALPAHGAQEAPPIAASLAASVCPVPRAPSPSRTVSKSTHAPQAPCIARASSWRSRCQTASASPDTAPTPAQVGAEHSWLSNWRGNGREANHTRAHLHAVRGRNSLQYLFRSTLLMCVCTHCATSPTTTGICKLCPRGTFSEGGTMEQCKPCPWGFTSDDGSVSWKECRIEAQRCPIGQWAPKDAVSDKECRCYTGFGGALASVVLVLLSFASTTSVTFFASPACPAHCYGCLSTTTPMFLHTHTHRRRDPSGCLRHLPPRHLLSQQGHRQVHSLPLRLHQRGGSHRD